MGLRGCSARHSLTIDMCVGGGGRMARVGEVGLVEAPFRGGERLW